MTFTVLMVYLGLVLFIGLYSHRLFRPTGESYFVADRSIGAFVLLMSLFGTNMTAFAILGASAEAYRTGIATFGKMASSSAIVVPAVYFFVGTRLWDPPDAPWADDNAEKIFGRELGRLRLSIEAGAKLEGERTIALIHYPPRFSDGRETGAVALLRDAGVEACIYGHLHGKDHAHGFQGVADGIRYYLTACDAIDFAPIEIVL